MQCINKCINVRRFVYHLTSNLQSYIYMMYLILKSIYILSNRTSPASLLQRSLSVLELNEIRYI